VISSLIGEKGKRGAVIHTWALKSILRLLLSVLLSSVIFVRYGGTWSKDWSQSRRSEFLNPPESPLRHAEDFIRTPPWLKQGYKRLEVLWLVPLYSNGYNSTIIRWSAEQGTYWNAEPQPSESSKGLNTPCGGWKKQKITPFLSISGAKRNDGEHQPITRVEFSLRHTEHFLRTLPELKQGYKRLEFTLLSPLYSNSSATAA
jgi:hypothetical protein